jgi:hypothetical protein
MRMTWLRALQEQVNIDERRRKNASKMKPAVQKTEMEKQAQRAAAQHVAMTDVVGVRKERMEMDAAKVRADAAGLADDAQQPHHLPRTCSVY